MENNEDQISNQILTILTAYSWYLPIFKNKLRNSAIEMSAYHTLSIFYETVLDKDFFKKTFSMITRELFIKWTLIFYSVLSVISLFFRITNKRFYSFNFYRGSFHETI